MEEDLKPIGGYFELELSNIDNFPHVDGIFVNTGRNALELILRTIPSIQNIYIPYYTCDVVLEPLKKININYSFYHINETLEIVDNIELKNNEYILYTNYFGVKDCYIKHLENKYGANLIVDNAQALYAKPTTKCLYSPRKFVGIPDSGIAYTDNSVNITSYATDYSFDRFDHLLIRHDKDATLGHTIFKENSTKLKEQDIKHTSILTKRVIFSIDFDAIKQKRIANFKYLHSRLKDSNLLDIDSFDSIACPMVYPYYTDDNTLKAKLIKNKIFVATYWPNVLEWCKPEDFEYRLANNIIAIPIDQRYGIEEMDRIIKIIKL